MKKLIIGWCGLALILPAMAQAQGTSAHKTPVQLEKERVIHVRMAKCIRKAQDGKLQPGTSQHKSFMGSCMRN